MRTNTSFIHWMGGKSRLLPTLTENMPKSFNDYYEPFIGGGALLFEIAPDNAYISDMNEELIIAYKVLQSRPEELIDDLSKHTMEAEYYYAIRNLDRDVEAFAQLSDIERASRFIYLTKSAFNGLYRVNRKGFHNAAFNKKKHVDFDPDHLRSVSASLQGIEIQHNDFEAIKSKVKSGDFVYFDPPYYLRSDNGYTKEGFGFQDHIRLKELCDHLNDIGAYFLLSNSCNKETLELFADYFVDFVDMKLSINPDAKKRGTAKEILVRNYQNVAQANNPVASVAKIA